MGWWGFAKRQQLPQKGEIERAQPSPRLIVARKHAQGRPSRQVDNHMDDTPLGNNPRSIRRPSQANA
eukprot:817498-Pyramimonas_sp.AAC.1